MNSVTPLSYLRYDNQETRDAFVCRQRNAYYAGKSAWCAGLINGQALQLYEELVRRVGTNQYCWIGEQALATNLQRSVTTIKRWMRQLVQANLIRRGRQFGHTTHTFIVAYERPEQPNEDHTADTSAELTGAALSLDVPASDTQADGDTNAEPAQGAAGIVFGVDHGPTIRPDPVRHTFKNQNSNTGGGGKPAFDESSESSATLAAVALLQSEGVADEQVLNELQDQPLEQIEYVVRYADRCRSTNDPRRPGLIVHLLRRGFGRQRCIRKAQTFAALPNTQQDTTGQGNLPSAPGSAATDWGNSWQQALGMLRTQVTPEDYVTWIEQSRLLLVEGQVAIVGTPNVFVRQEVERRFASSIAAVLSEIYARPLTVHAVIDTA